MATWPVAFTLYCATAIFPSGSTTNVAGPSRTANDYGTVALNLGGAAEGKQYRFQVRTNDGHDDSPWSDWCC